MTCANIITERDKYCPFSLLMGLVGKHVFLNSQQVTTTYYCCQDNKIDNLAILCIALTDRGNNTQLVFYSYARDPFAIIQISLGSGINDVHVALAVLIITSCG
jgi:hypothetical protein